MKLLTIAALIGTAWARCNNDCSGNGICNAGSVCECELNFLGNDCSDRLCLYGKAFVDSPLGDINADGDEDTDQQIRYQHANGLVGELYDTAYGLARDDNTQAWNEAHFYRECSNKGVCDRSTGQCACFPGFEGEGCRRITCPNKCSGHGQCVNMAVSNADYGAWDEKKTVECQCDPGYTGADCSLRKCPQGTDPIATVYINDDSVYKIEWGQTPASKKWGDQLNGKDIEFPNGQVHWTMSYQDDYGDVWTTSAVTTYYQLRTSGGSLIVGPSDTANNIVGTPFFMDPDFQGDNVATVNVDGGLKIGATATGTTIQQVYAMKTSTNAAAKTRFSFEPSFIGEQVNASIQALPNDVVRYSYVHTVYNYAADTDEVFIYPSMGVPKFQTTLNAKSLQAGTVGGTIVYATGSGHCSPHHSFLATSGCANVGNFAEGKSQAVNDNRWRFPYWISPDDTSVGPTVLTEKYTNCAANNLCVFITIPEPEGSKSMRVQYKFKTLIRTKATAEVAMKPNEYTESWAREISNVDGGTNSLVTITEVGSQRNWHKLIDGTPIIWYRSSQPLHDCSRRGLCDFETGSCKCFDGYSGYKCQERSVLGF